MRARLLAVPVLLAAGLACQSSPPPAARVPATPAERCEAFEAPRAWEHLGALAEIGPRVMGTEGGHRAGDYILGELVKLDLEVIEQEITVRRRAQGEQEEEQEQEQEPEQEEEQEPEQEEEQEPEQEEEQEPLELRNIAAKIPGSSSDIFLLLAPYDTRPYESFRFLGVNDGGSGAALLLEVARVLAADPLPYTTWLVFLDGEASLASSSAPVAPPSHFGSRALARQLFEEGVLAGVRLALVLNRVCDADLRIARDLLSHRIYREEFWRAAARVGRSDAFPPDASFESPVASHHPLAAVGLRRVVALVDTRFGGDEPPGLYAGTEDDNLEHCSAESLEAVGKVTLEALDKISQRLAKIDRFAKSPLEGTSELTFESPEPPPVADDAATPQTGDDAATPSEREGDGEPTEAPPEGPPATPSEREGDGEPTEAPSEGPPATPSAREGDGEPTEAPSEGPPATPSAREGDAEPMEVTPEGSPATPEAPEAPR
jgi:hypothetical protein